jgi:hypothetical protein
MGALKAWVHAALTPVFAFTALFAGFYALLISTSRSDWVLVAIAAVATIAAAIAAFVIRKTRPNLALALVTAPGVLLFAVIALR